MSHPGSSSESHSPVGPPQHPIAYWPGMLLAPAVFLAYQSAAYALVPYACQTLRHGAVHVASAIAVLVLLAALGVSIRDWGRDATGPANRADLVATRRRFLAHLALGSNAFALTATIALWYTQFVMPPCVG